MHKTIQYLVCLLILGAAVFTACTPKTSEQAQKTGETETPVEKPDFSDDPCAKFSDSKAGDEALNSHVIYRDYLRAKQYKEAMPYWRKAFRIAPAADGKRQTHFEDGITFYEKLLEQEATEAGKKRYLDSIMYMYDRLGQCYGDPGYVDGRKAFDLYYQHRSLTSDKVIFKHFAASLDTYGIEAPSFVINPFAALLAEMHAEDNLQSEKAKKYAGLILRICEAHAEDEENGWPIVLSYTPVRLEYFETVKGFYACDYYKQKYYEGVDLDSTDCEELFLVNTRLRWGGCEESNPELSALITTYNSRCAVTTTGPLRRAKDCLEEGDYSCAVDAYKEYIDGTDDPDRKAKYLLRIAKIYYAHLKNFPASRQYALKALNLKPNWGEPYMVIGKLYASSGPLCGPGRGWDSQIVTWPALDMFYKAKQIDSSVRAEADKLIRTYERYMPSNEDIHQRLLKEGDSFFVGCWIQENTTIRAAK